MSLAVVAKRAEQLVRDNSPAILTAIGVAGTIATAVLTAQATLKADKILKEEEELRNLSELSHPFDLTDPRTKIKLVWKCYIPAVGVGIVTVGAIISVNHIGSRRTAAMAAAYSILDKSFDEYRFKVVDKLGKDKEQALRDEIAQDRVNQTPASRREVVACVGGDVLCLDTYTGRYFTSSMEEIRKAVNTINYQILRHNYASLTDFYLLLGLPATIVSEEVGWNVDHPMDIQFSACMSDDDRPCMAINFKVNPVKGYHNFR